MHYIFCNLENASERINGIAFEPHPAGGMISVEPQPAAVSEGFAKITGYTLIEVSEEELATIAELERRKQELRSAARGVSVTGRPPVELPAGLAAVHATTAPVIVAPPPPPPPVLQPNELPPPPGVTAPAEPAAAPAPAPAPAAPSPTAAPDPGQGAEQMF
jgi:hypothetical protein